MSFTGQDSEDDDERLDPAVSLQSFEEFKNFTKDFQKVFVEDMTKLKNTFLELQIKIAVGRKGTFWNEFYTSILSALLCL